jgi:hypothetical protein
VFTHLHFDAEPLGLPWHSLPQVLVTAGYTGEIKIYENIGLPQWL